MPTNDLDLGMYILPELAELVKASCRQYFESEYATEIRPYRRPTRSKNQN